MRDLKLSCLMFLNPFRMPGKAAADSMIRLIFIGLIIISVRDMMGFIDSIQGGAL